MKKGEKAAGIGTVKPEANRENGIQEWDSYAGTCGEHRRRYPEL